MRVNEPIILYSINVKYIDGPKHEARVFRRYLEQGGVELRVVMDGLETRLNAVIEQIESWGGVRPKTDNSTTDYDKFTMTMESDYKNMLQQIKVLVAKVRNT
jgi:hypothetical protein